MEEDKADHTQAPRKEGTHSDKKNKKNREIFIFIVEKETVNSIRDAKVNHYTNIIPDAKDQKSLFNVMNELSNKKQDSTLPTHTSPKEHQF